MTALKIGSKILVAVGLLLAQNARAQAPNLIWESSPGGGPVVYAPDGKSLAVGPAGGTTVLQLGSAAGQLLRTYSGLRGGAAASLSFSPNGSLLAVGTAAANLNLKVFRTSDGSLLWSGTGHANGTRVAFSPDGTLLATTGPDKTTKIWRASDGTLIRSMSDGVRQVAVAYSPDGTLIASGNQGSIHLWRVSDGTLVHNLANGAGNALAFSPDGKSIASGTALFSVATGALVRSFPEPFPDGTVIAVAFTRDGAHLITGAEDFRYPDVDVGAIRFWSVATGALLHTYNQATGEMVNSLAVAPDGGEYAYSFADAVHGTSGVAIAHLPAF